MKDKSYRILNAIWFMIGIRGLIKEYKRENKGFNPETDVRITDKLDGKERVIELRMRTEVEE